MKSWFEIEAWRCYSMPISMRWNIIINISKFAELSMWYLMDHDFAELQISVCSCSLNFHQQNIGRDHANYLKLGEHESL